ncbi:hypothetical protein F8M49_22415 [Rhodococcus zopfii]|uniref:Uncharacterized protein n=1 Tax=Rhodococcus zopfii TaxID=43772 RepID=A0ABU3WUP5_9NOCA|nr:hypothetical protein [Rhodococcus zopfii]MDV2477457.1 hypothetical protein [Rhodococcus zopfii]
MADHPYDQQIEINAAGITIGSTSVPGLIDHHSVNVQRNQHLPGHWTVTATFVTSKEPIAGAGIDIHPDGSVTVDHNFL